MTTDPKPCSFCEALRMQKTICRLQNSRPENDNEPMLEEYSVALVIRSWLKGRPKRTAGRTTDYRYRGCGYRLNYCPTCGKKI